MYWWYWRGERLLYSASCLIFCYCDRPRHHMIYGCVLRGYETHISRICGAEIYKKKSQTCLYAIKVSVSEGEAEGRGA